MEIQIKKIYLENSQSLATKEECKLRSEEVMSSSMAQTAAQIEGLKSLFSSELQDLTTMKHLTNIIQDSNFQK